MCVTICGRFCPDEGVVAGYDNRIRAKYTAKWGVQIAGMLFQTRSSTSKIKVSAILTQDDFFICKAEEGGVAVATATDVGAADEKSDKSIWQLLNIRCTSCKFAWL